MQPPISRNLAGKNVLVTGASSGIGQAIALRFAQEGCHVAINYRKSAQEAEDTQAAIMQQVCGEVEACHVKSALIQGDVSREEDVVRMVAETVEHLGSIDILVNNAGIQTECAAHEISLEDYDRVLNVNLRGSFLCAREALKHFLAQNSGVIINISSVHEIIPRPFYLTYSLSKGGMGNLTRSLALEYAARGIRVNGIAPGATITPINDAWIQDPEQKAVVESHIPMGRAGTAAEMAAATVFLASDEAAYITGQTLYIDGGLTLYADFREAWSA